MNIYLFCRCWYLLLLGLLILRPCILSSLQNAASVITNCDSLFITKCGKWYYNVRQFYYYKSTTEHGSQHCCNINCILNICRQYYSSLCTLWKTWVSTSPPASKFWVLQVWHIFHALSVMTILLATGSSFQTKAWPCVFLFDRGSGVFRKINVCSAVPFQFTNMENSWERS